jgi:hypothetical protein
MLVEEAATAIFNNVKDAIKRLFQIYNKFLRHDRSMHTTSTLFLTGTAGAKQ